MQTALIVPVPAAEPVVGRFRAGLDRAAAWDVPAHVTVLFPFLAPERIDAAVLADVRAIVAGFPRTDVVLERVEWFGDEVVWVAPRPDDVFRELTMALWRRFPEAPPYAGAHDEVVPHLTVGHGAGRPVLEAAAREVAARLPVRASVDVVRLISGHTGQSPWRTVNEFSLGREPSWPSP
ncbi:2'-5' RNA ligase family protein [Paractinoplanes rishiriensis]|uniref:2'-5' RNA ligase n=1 Tax=Paractinoplanes rishiriensis TaxID=1050105 RepID=A0A919K825_9ACTN|nr:2'-5' RNA ligase family protein [Actinoplanes rishiriensis]GIF00483.1 hypothetical protein Ari01nite_79470 [Actinoplanes rishiriensis]